jgi:succinoglycan biosynthesis transport protein ExoP
MRTRYHPMMAKSEPGQLDLHGYLAVVQRRKLIIVLCVVGVVAAALTVSLLQTPLYQAHADIVFRIDTTEAVLSPQRAIIGPQVATEIEVMQSRSVREAVAQELGTEPDVSVAPVGETRVVSISAKSADPAEAANIANVYAETYITTRQQQVVGELLAASDQVQARVDELDTQIDQLERPLADLDAQIGGATSSDLPALQVQRSALERDIDAQRDTLVARRDSYAAQLDQLQLARNLTGEVVLVGRAVEPTSPVEPTPKRNALLALVVGLMLGVGLAFVREQLDDTVKNKEELERATGGLGALALIPAVADWKDRVQPQVVSLTDPASPAAEAYRSLRTSVQFMGLHRPVQAIQLTSPNASEGKTTTLANLAVALAGSGQKVVVVCCDLRRPRIHEFFGLTNTTGFTSVLLGEIPLSIALQNVPEQSRLSLLASGPTPPNPSELLASQRAGDVLSALRSECDVVLVDSAPVLPVTDSIVLSRMVDATILVGTAGRTTRKEYQRAVELLNQVDAPLIGSVLNGVEEEDLYGFGYGYGYYRASEADGGEVANGDGSGTTAPARPRAVEVLRRLTESPQRR